MTINFHSDELTDVFGSVTGRTTHPDALADAIDRAGPCDNLDEKLPSPRPVHTEPCPKCRGSGRYSDYSSRGQHCFKCRGAGRLTFKNSAETRARAREAGARRREARAERQRAQAAVDMDLWMEEHRDEGLWIEQKRGTFGFAASMHSALQQWGGLTEGQLAAVRRCMAQDAERAARRVAQEAERAARSASAPTLDVSRIEAAFAEAKRRAARPGQQGVFTRPLRLASSEATGSLPLQFRPGSAGSQWEGMLFVRTEDGRKLGHVQGGKFHRRFECTEAELAAVVDAASDPERSLVAYAKAWSRCGVCGRGLLNDVSIERGIGPICAARFGFFGS